MLNLHVCHGVAVNTFGDIALDRIGVSALDDSLCGFCAVFVLSLDEITFPARSVPCVSFLVRFEIRLQSGCIFGSLVPYFAQRYLEEQDTVVVLLYEVLQFRIFRLQMFVGIGFYLSVGHLRRQVILDAGFADEALVGLFGTLVSQYLSLDLRSHGVERLNTAFALFENQVPTVLAANRSANLSFSESERRVFERFDHLSFSEPTQFAATHTTAAVFGLA